MDKRAVEQGDIHFFELAALSVAAKADKREVALTLTDFMIPPDDVPEDVRRTVKHWSQWMIIGRWIGTTRATHSTTSGKTYRTRKEPKLDLETKHTYDAPGEYTVVVKVIDILGNDTTKDGEGEGEVRRDEIVYRKPACPNFLFTEDAREKTRVTEVFFEWLKLSEHKVFSAEIVFEE